MKEYFIYVILLSKSWFRGPLFSEEFVFKAAHLKSDQTATFHNFEAYFRFNNEKIYYRHIWVDLKLLKRSTRICKEIWKLTRIGIEPKFAAVTRCLVTARMYLGM